MMNSSALEHDFHNTWDSVLGVTELQNRPIASSLLKEYWQDSVKVERNYGKILSQYTDMFEKVPMFNASGHEINSMVFRDFFGGILPISFHGHVSDALCPVTTMGMLVRLAIFSRCDTPESIHAPTTWSRAELAGLLGLTEMHLEKPRWVVVEGSYATGFGPLANLSGHAPFHDHATGNLGISLKISGRSTASLVASLSAAKQQGCIGVVVEIVSNQSNGRVTSPDELKALSEACRLTGLLLAIDETITAIRCGAPFAFQRLEYQECGGPDLVFFGKALGAQGIGINFDGPRMSRLGIDVPLRRKQAVCDWQAVVTQALHLPVLINAIGVLEMAVAGDWVGRSRIVGHHLRQTVVKRAQSRCKDVGEADTEILGGLDSFIFVHRKISSTFLVMGALAAGSGDIHWVRWLPRLDRQLTEISTVESLLSANRKEKRAELSRAMDEQGLRPQWCFYCGTWARGTEYPWCRACCIDACDAEERIRALQAHECVV